MSKVFLAKFLVDGLKYRQLKYYYLVQSSHESWINWQGANIETVHARDGVASGLTPSRTCVPPTLSTYIARHKLDLSIHAFENYF